MLHQLSVADSALPPCARNPSKPEHGPSGSCRVRQLADHRRGRRWRARSATARVAGRPAPPKSFSVPAVALGRTASRRGETVSGLVIVKSSLVVGRGNLYRPSLRHLHAVRRQQTLGSVGTVRRERDVIKLRPFPRLGGPNDELYPTGHRPPKRTLHRPSDPGLPRQHEPLVEAEQSREEATCAVTRGDEQRNRRDVGDPRAR